MDMWAWGKNESDKISLKWLSALKIYCCEDDPGYMMNWLYGHNLPKNQQAASFTLLMLTSFLKLLSHLRQKIIIPGNHKRAIETCFCNRPGCTQRQEADSHFLTSLWVPYWPRQTKHSGSSILNQLPKAEQEHFQQSSFAGWCCFFPWLGYEAAFILNGKTN